MSGIGVYRLIVGVLPASRCAAGLQGVRKVWVSAVKHGDESGRREDTIEGGYSAIDQIKSLLFVLV